MTWRIAGWFKTSAPPATLPTPPSCPASKYVDLGGVRMTLHCTGLDRPDHRVHLAPVIGVPGSGAVLFTWEDE